MFCQVSVLILFITVIDCFLRKRVWPQVRYALWFLVLVKLILPPTLSTPTSVATQADKFIPASPVEFWMPISDAPPFNPHSEPGSERDRHESIPIPAQSPPMIATHSTPSISGPTLHWRVYVMGLWLTGVLTLLVFALLRIQHLRKIHGHQVKHMDLPPWFDSLLAETTDRLHLKHTPKVALSELVLSPAVIGPFRPILVLPSAGMDRLTRQHMEHVLLHELAHIKRADLLFNTFGALLHIVYWFNPLLLLVQRRLRHLRELCCDATVAKLLREKTTDYRETILENAHWLLSQPAKHGLGFLGLVEDSNHLLMRLAWLEKKTWRHQRLRIIAVLSLITIMSICILPMARAEKSGKPETTGAETTLSTEDSSAASDSSVLSFPQNRSMGVVYTREPGPYPPGEYGLGAKQGWQRHADARGEVVVPEGKEVSLRVSSEACADLSPLQSLSPDSLTALEFVNITVPGDHILEHVKHLTGTPHLTFHACTGLTSRFLSYFSHWDALEHLVVSNWNPATPTFDRESTALLAGFKKLHTLELVNCKIPDECWPELERLKQLRQLNLINTTMSDVGLAHVAACRSLEYLHVRTQGISIEGVQQLGRLQNLQELGIDVNPPLCSALMDQIGKIHGLKRFRLHRSKLSDKDTKELARLENLDHFEANFSAIGNETLTRLAHLKTLKWIQIRNTNITDFGLIHLKGLSQLEGLNLSNTKITSAGLVHLRELSNLKELWIHNTNVDSEGLNHLKGLSKLQKLGLGNTKVTSAGLVHLKELTELTTLQLGQTRVTYDGLAHLTSLPLLKTLYLPTTVISDPRTLDYIDEIPALKHTALLGPAIEAGDAKQVEWLIAKGVDIHVTQYTGRHRAMRGPHSSALHVAALYGQQDIVQILLDNGANINATNGFQQIPLHLAADTGKKSVAKLLIAKGAHVDARDRWGYTPLHDAATKGRLDIVHDLLVGGANVSATDTSGQTPLHLAADFGSRNLCELLIAKGADVQARDKAGNTVLHQAIKRDPEKEILELFLAKGADVNARNDKGETPLHLIRRTRIQNNGREAAAVTLLSHGAAVNAKDKNGRTPLHVASESGQRKIVTLLLSKGALINEKANDGTTALHLAVKAGHADIVELLLSQGGGINLASSKGMTALYYAAQDGNNDLIEMLCARGADVNAKNDHGDTPPHAALSGNHTDSLVLLFSKGANIATIHLAAYVGDLVKVKGFIKQGIRVDTPDGYGLTPLHTAVGGGRLEVAEYLISRDASANAETGEEGLGTPLHYAADNGSAEVTKRLISNGALIDAKNQEGATPLHVAAGKGHTALVKELLIQGANLEAKDKIGRTPLYYAAREGRQDTVSFLVEYGADIHVMSNWGRTLLYPAVVNNHEDIAKYLMDRGTVSTEPALGGLLLWAVWNEQKDIAERLLKQGADANTYHSEDRGTPLTFSTIKQERADLLKLLLEHGANPNGRDWWGWSLLHYSCYIDNGLDITQLLLEKGADPHVKERQRGATPLHYAAHKGHKAIVELLIDHGADVNAKDNQGRSPLTYAKDMDATNLFGLPWNPPLTEVSKQAKKEIVEQLSKQGTKKK